MVAGIQPAKRVKQGITDYLTTAQNLKSADMGLKNAYSGVVSNMAKASDQAAEGATAKTQEVAKSTSAETLASGVPRLDTSAYAQPQAKHEDFGSAPRTLTDYLQGWSPDERANVRTAGAGEVKAKQETGLEEAGKKASEATQDYFKKATQTLDEGTTKILDSAGNTIGSNASVGQVGQAGALESQALGLQQSLASGVGSTSNIDALRSLLGVGYDPRLAGMASQVYQGDITTARGQAAQEVEARKQAESGRTRALEGYLGELEKGKGRVEKAKGEAETTLAKDLADARSTIQGNYDRTVQAIAASTPGERRKYIAESQPVIDALVKTASQPVSFGNRSSLEVDEARSHLTRLREVFVKKGMPTDYIDKALKAVQSNRTAAADAQGQDTSGADAQGQDTLGADALWGRIR